MSSQCSGPVSEEFNTAGNSEKHRESNAVAGTLTPGTFTLHGQSYTNPAVQAEQEDELMRKLGSTGLDNKRAGGGSPLQVVTLSQGWSNVVLQLGGGV